MRKSMCALMMTLLVLVGCSRAGNGGGSAAEQLALTIRGEYLAMVACAATVDITADYGERVYEYTMSISWQKDGETLLTILAPENIAGLTAHIRDGSAYLEYDGASLETGDLTTEGLSPMEVIPAAIDGICTGYIAECDMEQVDDKEQLWVCCRAPETDAVGDTESETQMAFWFDTDTHALTRVEVSSDGYVVIQCVFTDFTME